MMVLIGMICALFGIPFLIALLIAFYLTHDA